MRRRVLALLVCVGVLLAAPLLSPPAEAANKVAIADGNWTTAGTWATADTTGTLISTSASTTTLTTGNLDSATFTPGAITVSGFLVRIGSRASGSPSNTMTITLRNSTDAVNVQACTINVSDLPPTNTTDDQGGWVFCHFNANSLLIAAKAYLIRATLSATTTAVALSTNGTANNWQHILVTSTTGAPAAGDDEHIAGWYNNSASPATLTLRTVTMDSTATTDYGSANTSYRVAACNISRGGVLTWGTTASTNYRLRLSGDLVVYYGGTYRQGSTATGAIPISSTAELQFDPAVDLDFGMICRTASTCQTDGSQNIAGSNTVMVRLNADAAGGATTLTVSAQLSAKNGDDIGIGGTSTTTTQAETRTLNADCTATTCTVSSGLTNAHNGDNLKQAMVIALSRNVRIVSVTSTLATFVQCLAPGANCDFRWTEFRYVGTSTAGVDISADNPVLLYCSFRDSEGRALLLANGSTVTISVADLEHLVFYSTAANANGTVSFGTGTITGLTMNDINLMNTSGTQFGAIFPIALGSVCTQCDNWWATGYATGIQVTSSTLGAVGALVPSVTFNNWEANSNTTGIVFGNTASGGGFHLGDFTGLKVWSNTTTGMQLVQSTGMTFTNFRADGNGTNLFLAGSSGFVQNVTFYTPTICGATTRGVGFSTGLADRILFVGALFGTAGTSCTANTGNTDVQPTSNHVAYNAAFVNADFDQTVGDTVANSLHVVASSVPGSRFTFTGTVGVTGTWSDVASFGIVAKRSGGNCTNASCITLIPNTLTADSAKGANGGVGRMLLSNGNERGHGYLLPVDTTCAPTVSVDVTYSGTGGSQPRLIVLQSNDTGVSTTDQIVDTAGASPDTLTWTAPTPTASGVVEFVVGIDGTAGSVAVENWRATCGPTLNPDGRDYYYLGYPFTPFYRVFPATMRGRVF